MAFSFVFESFSFGGSQRSEFSHSKAFGESDLESGNSLLEIYAKCEKVNEALKYKK